MPPETNQYTQLYRPATQNELPTQFNASQEPNYGSTANPYADQIKATAGLQNTVNPAFTIGNTNYSLIGNSSSFIGKDGSIDLKKLQTKFGDGVTTNDFKNINGQLYHIHNQNFLERNGQAIGAGFATLGAINSVASTIDNINYHNGMLKVYKNQNDISEKKLKLSTKEYNDLLSKRSKIDSQLNK